MVVLGLDLGFARVGWAVLRLSPKDEEIVELGTIRTRRNPQPSKTNGDLHRRGRELASAIDTLIAAHRPALICAEALCLSRNASASAQTGRAWGVVDALCAARQLPLLEVSPFQLKWHATANMAAAKHDVLDALDLRFDGALRSALSRAHVAPSQQEHPALALAAIVASLESETIRSLRKHQE
jgi:Holliday junction resolvasome RuvABC endonuclease subunit